MKLEIEDRSFSKFRKRPYRLYIAGSNKYNIPTQETIANYATKEAAERAKKKWLDDYHDEVVAYERELESLPR
jgi:hypothetical protein